MATLQPRITKRQFAEKFRAAFPDWAVDLNPTELMAISPMPLTPEQVDEALRKLTILATGHSILIAAQRRAGYTVLTVDVRSLPH